MKNLMNLISLKPVSRLIPNKVNIAQKYQALNLLHEL